MIIERGNSVIRQAPERNWLILQADSSRVLRRNVTALQSLKEEVAAKHGITVPALESSRQERCRTPALIAARVEYCQRAYAMGGYSLPEIGRSINRHHTTVLHHVRKGQGQ